MYVSININLFSIMITLVTVLTVSCKNSYFLYYKTHHITINYN